MIHSIIRILLINYNSAIQNSRIRLIRTSSLEIPASYCHS